MNTIQPALQSDTDLGGVSQLMRYMRLKRSYMQAIKRCAQMRDSKENPSCFAGSKSCKRWIMRWLLRNRDFKVALAYPRKNDVPGEPDLPA